MFYYIILNEGTVHFAHVSNKWLPDKTFFISYIARSFVL